MVTVRWWVMSGQRRRVGPWRSWSSLPSGALGVHSGVAGGAVGPRGVSTQRGLYLRRAVSWPGGKCPKQGQQDGLVRENQATAPPLGLGPPWAALFPWSASQHPSHCPLQNLLGKPWAGVPLISHSVGKSCPLWASGTLI